MHAAEFPLLFFRQFGLFAAQFSLGAGMAMPSRVRIRMRSVSNPAKVARMLKNIFPIGPAKAVRTDPRRQPRLRRPALDHPERRRPRHRPVFQPVLPTDRAVPEK